MSTLVRELDRHGALAADRLACVAAQARAFASGFAGAGSPGKGVAALEAEYAGLTGTRVVSSNDD